MDAGFAFPCDAGFGTSHTGNLDGMPVSPFVVNGVEERMYTMNEMDRRAFATAVEGTVGLGGSAIGKRISPPYSVV